MCIFTSGLTLRMLLYVFELFALILDHIFITRGPGFITLGTLLTCCVKPQTQYWAIKSMCYVSIQFQKKGKQSEVKRNSSFSRWWPLFCFLQKDICFTCDKAEGFLISWTLWSSENGKINCFRVNFLGLSLYKMMHYIFPKEKNVFLLLLARRNTTKCQRKHKSQKGNWKIMQQK